MPFCAMSRGAALQDITPVENVFIQEYMLRAPGDYVKVYLYGLMHCRFPDSSEDSGEAFARALGLEESVVLEAFAYWQRRGLVQVRTLPSFAVEYRLAREVMLGNVSGEQHLYDLAAFNQAVQDLFGQRMFRDFERVYDWLDTYHFSEAVALRLIQYCVAQKGKNVRIAYMDSVAKAWADANITTVEQAEDYITGCRLAASPAKAVLTHIGLKRRPTVDEDALYAKWTQQWGFTEAAILLCCKEMTRIQNPNFQYIDRVLEHYYRMRLTAEKDIDEHMHQKGKQQQAVTVLFHTLGIKGSPGAQMTERYSRWLTQWGFSPDGVLAVCQYVATRRPSTLDALEALLEQLYKLGCVSDAAIAGEMETRQIDDDELRLLFGRLGLNRSPSAAERNALNTWRAAWDFPLELVLYGAEFAVGADRPFAFLQKVLSNWHALGIVTVGAAKEHSRLPLPAKGAAAKTGKPSRSLMYEQRDYADEALDSLGIPLNNK